MNSLINWLLSFAIAALVLAHAPAYADRGDESYVGNVTYELREYAGIAVVPEIPGIGFHLAVSPSAADYLDYRRVNDLTHLQDLPRATAMERIVLHFIDQAELLGVPSYRFTAVLYGGVIPRIILNESDEWLLQRIFGASSVRWIEVHRTATQERIVRNDVRDRFLDPQLSLLKKLVNTTLRHVLGPEHESVALRREDLILQLKSSQQEWATLANFLEKQRQDFTQSPTNLRLSGAESAWAQANRSLVASMANVVKHMSTFEERLGAGLKDYFTYRQAISYFVAQRASEDEKRTSAQDAEELVRDFAAREVALASVASSKLSDFLFSARDSLNQWNHISPGLLLPLYSYGLLSALAVVEAHASFSEWMYGFKSMNGAIEGILRAYLQEQKFTRFDAVTHAVLSTFVSKQALRPLLRLAAYLMLENEIGPEAAQAMCRFSPSDFAALYRTAQADIELSPTEISARPKAHIDLDRRWKSDVSAFVELITAAGKARGLPAWDLPVRAQIHSNKEFPRSDIDEHREILGWIKSKRKCGDHLTGQ